MRSLIQLTLVGLLATAVAGCSQECGNRIAMASAQGTLTDGPTILATVSAAAEDDQIRGLRTFAVRVWATQGSAGAPLRGHLLGARLMTSDGQLLREVPIDSQGRIPEILATVTDTIPDMAAYERMRDALATGKAMLVVETDLPGLERIEAVLAQWTYQPITQLTCPYT